MVARFNQNPLNRVKMISTNSASATLTHENREFLKSLGFKLLDNGNAKR